MSSATKQSEFIDVQQRIRELSIEELCASAESYFAERANWDSLLAKPFAEIEETPELLVCFAHVVRGLRLLPDMTILDFGAGTCWTSRFLSQLGLKVIALDVSESALKIGRRLYRRHPLIGHRPAPRFMRFDGLTIDLPAESVERISCWEALHHAANPERIIQEMGRILKPGGIAGFSEPGPDHSKSAQSQVEMRDTKLIENDIKIGELWDAARHAGFTDMKVAVFNPEPLLFGLADFEKYLEGQDNETISSETRRQMQARRLFFLFKGDPIEPRDSRSRAGLKADLRVSAAAVRVAARHPLSLQVTVRNVGDSTWLPTPEAPPPWWQRSVLKRFGRQPHMGPDRIPPRVGGVRLGIQLLNHDGEMLDLDYFRYHLTPGAGREIQPGETAELAIKLPMPPKGSYLLHCDLVSEGVGWFADGAPGAVRLPIEVI